jgi:3-deoxy-manno-octulosonate cytidylyltransferase (CMP-KDO synthetase)
LSSAVVVIPARYGSTRFPAKIVAAETGKPLVQHVVDQVKQCKLVRECIVATDDKRIVDALKPFGTRCVMTDSNHPSGTDRVAEVVAKLKDDIIVNVQGDEPEIEPETIDQLINELYAAEANMATAATPFPPHLDVNNPDLVKVVTDKYGWALYFSRSVIPYARDAGPPPPPYYLHLGIYAYARPFLLRVAGWMPTPAEMAEKLEQLRVLQHGEKILVTIVDRATHGIDTPEQYAAFVDRYKKKTRAK